MAPMPHFRRHGDQRPTVERAHSGLWHSLRASLQAASYTNAKPALPNTSAPRRYEGEGGNTAFWKDAHGEVLWDRRRVELRQFHLTEWVPLQPGRHLTPYASNARRRARMHMEFTTSSPLGQHYLPLGKTSMLESGIGCARFRSVELDGQPYHLLGASFSGNCDEGIPIFLTERDYEQMAWEIRDLGVVIASVSARAELLPTVLLGRGPSPTAYCLKVDSIEIDRHPARAIPTAAVFISFQGARQREDDAQSWLTSYCHFTPGRRSDTMHGAVDWLRTYVDKYGRRNTPIVADFDAYHDYFDRVEMTISELVAGDLPLNVLTAYATRLGQPIHIGDVVLGDQFKNVQNSTVVNRSDIQGEVPKYTIRPHRNGR
jgi:hypothetical protein